MRFAAAFALLTGIVLITGSGLLSQEKKDSPDKKDTGKVKGILPPYWAKLDLSRAVQRQDIYKIQSKYKDELKKLKEKEEELKAEERREMEKVLTADQKKKLIEIVTGEKKDTPKDTPAKDSPKDKVAPKDEKPKDKN